VRDGGRRSTIEETIAAVPAATLTSAMRALGYPSDEVEVGYNCLLIQTGRQQVLIDTGTGRGELITNLRQAGIKPEDIDVIILTHGDGDHIGGIVNEQGGLAFPNARYILWREAWTMWTLPEGRAYMIEQFLDLMRRRGVSTEELNRMASDRTLYGTKTLPLIRDRLELVDLEKEFLPGFRLIPAAGHRSDQTAVSITSAGAHLLHVADAIRHPVQVVHPEWNGHIDSFAEPAVETRRRLLARVAADEALIFAAHLSFPGLGYARQQADGWSWTAVAAD
jgi:glyoxylase-like metal-dependent hydrolase (beta-lactamase superfamily II)